MVVRQNVYLSMFILFLELRRSSGIYKTFHIRCPSAFHSICAILVP